MTGPDEPSHSRPSIWDDSVGQYQQGGFKLYWELLPAILKYQYRSMTGDENRDHFSYTLDCVRQRMGNSGLRALSLGCSQGDPSYDMGMIASGLFDRVEVMDIAGGLLEKQRAVAARRGLAGIEYVRQDLNEVVLERNQYDLIWAEGTIHHIDHLESLFEQISMGLRPSGLFVMREYVGPNRLQYSYRQLGVVNEILSVLPEKYRRMRQGELKSIMRPPKLAELLLWDPSESIRSADILDVMKQYLEAEYVAYTGGTILQPLLGGIASNFEGSEEADTVLQLLIVLEETLITQQVLPSDFVFCLARKKGGKRRRRPSEQSIVSTTKKVITGLRQKGWKSLLK